MSRTVSRLLAYINTSDGGGFKLKRSIGGVIDDLDPFLLLDEFHSQESDGPILGFPNHPHRGFETSTYMLAGNMEHGDHKGNKGNLVAGSVQWMTAGKGIIHSEIPKRENGLVWGFQLWVNLPAKDKMCPPRYQDIPPENIPEVTKDGIKVRVIAGEYDGVLGAVKGIATNPTYLDVALPKGASFKQSIPQGHTVFAYVFVGDGSFGPKESPQKVPLSHLAVFEDGEFVEAQANDSDFRFLLVSGKPLNEPIARRGPFVMNTREELYQAFTDYQMGRF